MQFVKTSVLKSTDGIRSTERKTKVSEPKGLDYFSDRDAFVSEENAQKKHLYSTQIDERGGHRSWRSPGDAGNIVKEIQEEQANDYLPASVTQDEYEFLEYHHRQKKRAERSKEQQLEEFRRSKSQSEPEEPFYDRIAQIQLHKQQEKEKSVQNAFKAKVGALIIKKRKKEQETAVVISPAVSLEDTVSKISPNNSLSHMSREEDLEINALRDSTDSLDDDPMDSSCTLRNLSDSTSRSLSNLSEIHPDVSTADGIILNIESASQPNVKSYSGLQIVYSGVTKKSPYHSNEDRLSASCWHSSNSFHPLVATSVEKEPANLTSYPPTHCTVASSSNEDVVSNSLKALPVNISENDEEHPLEMILGDQADAFTEETRSDAGNEVTQDEASECNRKQIDKGNDEDPVFAVPSNSLHFITRHAHEIELMTNESDEEYVKSNCILLQLPSKDLTSKWHHVDFNDTSRLQPLSYSKNGNVRFPRRQANILTLQGSGFTCPPEDTHENSKKQWRYATRKGGILSCDCVEGGFTNHVSKVKNRSEKPPKIVSTFSDRSSTLESPPNSFLFTCCDGHGGYEAAEFVAHKIAVNFHNMHETLGHTIPSSWIDTTAQLESFYRDIAYHTSNSQGSADTAGACFVSAFLKGNTLSCASLGDCKVALICVERGKNLRVQRESTLRNVRSDNPECNELDNPTSDRFSSPLDKETLRYVVQSENKQKCDETEVCLEGEMTTERMSLSELIYPDYPSKYGAIAGGNSLDSMIPFGEIPTWSPVPSQSKWGSLIKKQDRDDTCNKPMEPLNAYWRVIWLSREHRCSLPFEYRRIQSYGNMVVNGRVKSLEPSRTIGDFDVKDLLPEGVISIVPDVVTLDISSPSILIIGTDGLWDGGIDEKVLLHTFKKQTNLWKKFKTWAKKPLLPIPPASNRKSRLKGKVENSTFSINYNSSPLRETNQFLYPETSADVPNDDTDASNNVSVPSASPLTAPVDICRVSERAYDESSADACENCFIPYDGPEAPTQDELRSLCRSLIRKAIRQGSVDDISCVAIFIAPV
ncbi:protein phosphatase 2C domain-containing protein [Cardiosporidium cionae]|uniref:protein-serine/threonine phosphatase n=1 Tax=Cardiosporidium cionae TaxID=476202 RepID=A0ABQ7J8R8_9APIC|nr:protein phosphatase 2C domain-containing protein [Cardiosporidium cionae]|eukprot:KAF8820365.1 protein phosphatase 2C domain-containing protein [Cardiosporidium cionae]